LSRDLSSIQSAPSAAAKLKEVGAAVPRFRRCPEALELKKGHPGYDPNFVFDTALGKVSVGRLMEACRKESQRLADQLKPLQWLVDLDLLGTRFDAAAAQLDNAERSSSAQERVHILGASIGGLQECIERADSMSKDPAASSTAKTKTAQGEITLKSLRSACSKMQQKAKDSLQRAKVEEQVEAFIRRCKADEKAVAQREGLPKHIEQYRTGRVFVYQPPKGSSLKRFAFDANGNRVDIQVLESQNKEAPKIVEP
jgi:hypothetical protein